MIHPEFRNEPVTLAVIDAERVRCLEAAIQEALAWLEPGRRWYAIDKPATKDVKASRKARIKVARSILRSAL